MKWTTLFPVVLLALVTSCSSEGGKTTMETAKGRQKVRSVEILQNGSKQSFNVTHNADGSVQIETMSSRGQNIGIRSLYNKKGKLIEMISGADRVNYLYGPGDRVIEIDFQKQNQRLVFEHDEQGRIRQQFTITNGDTTSVYSYNYEGTSRTPCRVGMSTKRGILRSYRLTYSDRKNRLTNLFESVFPVESVFWLGWPAVYGETYLKSAELQSARGGSSPGMRKMGSIFTFDVQTSDGKETIKLTSDGTRQWSIVIGLE